MKKISIENEACFICNNELEGDYEICNRCGEKICWQHIRDNPDNRHKYLCSNCFTSRLKLLKEHDFL